MNKPQSAVMSIPFVLGFYGVMGFSGSVWLFFETGSAMPTIIPEKGNLLGYCVVAGVFSLFIISLTPTILRMSRPLRQLTLEIRSLLGNLSHKEVLILALASGIGEELLFRGAIQESFGLIWASIIFGLLHGLPGTRLAHWGIFAFIVGLFFGVLQEQSQSLLPPIIAHFGINYINIKRIVRGDLYLETPADTKS